MCEDFPSSPNFTMQYYSSYTPGSYPLGTRADLLCKTNYIVRGRFDTPWYAVRLRCSANGTSGYWGAIAQSTFDEREGRLECYLSIFICHFSFFNEIPPEHIWLNFCYIYTIWGLVTWSLKVPSKILVWNSKTPQLL